ncbi:uncharacterized protein LOC107006106 [Solanum pennellii]|uniref:Uncharacterized protein LOC107006106 n=1 Tax=Solanum pennellii TaxID=28526 RepID=A0ABM1FQJ6_SOLPN|nr:uncharacterized protein LOC107006106 [Solanum pennellii]
MRAHDKVEVFDIYRALKLPSIYEELSAITVVDKILESQVVLSDDPLESVKLSDEQVDAALKILKHTKKVTGWFLPAIHHGFFKIARPMWSLLEKDVKFNFDAMCMRGFEMLKRNLIQAPILIAPDWELPSELMCDASDVTVGVVLGQ